MIKHKIYIHTYKYIHVCPKCHVVSSMKTNIYTVGYASVTHSSLDEMFDILITYTFAMLTEVKHSSKEIIYAENMTD